MQLLVLSPSYPFPPGNGIHLRMNDLFRRLPPGCEIRLICFEKVTAAEEAPLPAPFAGTGLRIPMPPPVRDWRASPLVQLLRTEPGMVWKFQSTEFEAAVRERSRGADAALAISLQMGQYLPALPDGMPRALDNVNVEARILKRMALTRPLHKRWYWRLEAAKLGAAERRLMLQAGDVFAISEVDREELARMAPGARVRTVPMGADLDYFGEDPRAPEEGPVRFACVGALDWLANEDAVLWLADHVWPRVREALPDAELSIVGRSPGERILVLDRRPGIRVFPSVPDVRPFLAGCRAQLVPLRYGSGVRTKILASFAAACPVISTPVGCEGIPARNGEHLLVADGEEAFAAACVRLAREPETASRLAASGRVLVEELDRQATIHVRAALRETLGLG